MIVRRTFVSLVFVLTLIGDASAHRFSHPKVLRLGVQADRVVLGVSYDVNPGADALRTRGLFDRNADGQLDEAEQKKLETYLVQTSMMWIRLWIDGAAIELGAPTITRHRFDRAADDSSTLGLAMMWSIPRRAGGTIRIDDRDKDRDRHVPIVVDVAKNLSVELSTQGEWDPDARRIFGARLAPKRNLELRLRAEP